jgi:hypothetical protein
MESEFPYHFYNTPSLDPNFSQISPNHRHFSVPYAMKMKPSKLEAPCNISCDFTLYALNSR